MVDAPKDSAIEGGLTTAKLAEAVLPVPPFAEVAAAVVLFCRPAAVPVTFTEKMQVPAAAMVAPERLTMPVACIAVMAPPPHEPARPFGVATTRPIGNVSEKATPVRADVTLLFWMVNESEAEPPSGTLPAPK